MGKGSRPATNVKLDVRWQENLSVIAVSGLSCLNFLQMTLDNLATTEKQEGIINPLPHPSIAEHATLAIYAARMS